MIKALLALEDGSIFLGDSIGVVGCSTGEVVFNTAMTGYQEILTDPSYAQQIITLTYPHIGNVGTNLQDSESNQIHCAGLVIKNLPILSSNFRETQTLSDYLKSNNIVAIANIDTRRLARILRNKGAQKGYIVSSNNLSKTDAIQKAQAFAGLKGMDLAKIVSTKSPYQWLQTSWNIETNNTKESDKFNYHVVVYDFGVKYNILRLLVDRGCKLTIVPATTTADKVLAMKPDGVFLSNGPGDPEPCDYAQSAIQTLLKENIPMFGICLGHQLLALASGAKTTKMKFGHHGANHPVQDLINNKVMITSQNHGFMIDENTLPTEFTITHKSLFDNSIQGIHHKTKPVFGFQGHPEASPGPQDMAYLFDDFLELMENNKN